MNCCVIQTHTHTHTNTGVYSNEKNLAHDTEANTRAAVPLRDVITIYALRLNYLHTLSYNKKVTNVVKQSEVINMSRVSGRVIE